MKVPSPNHWTAREFPGIPFWMLPPCVAAEYSLVCPGRLDRAPGQGLPKQKEQKVQECRDGKARPAWESMKKLSVSSSVTPAPSALSTQILRCYDSWEIGQCHWDAVWRHQLRSLDLTLGAGMLVKIPIRISLSSCPGFPGGSDGEESACNAGDLCPIFGSGRSPGEGYGLLSLRFLQKSYVNQKKLSVSSRAMICMNCPFLLIERIKIIMVF